MSKECFSRQSVFVTTLGMIILCVVLLAGCTEANGASPGTPVTIVKMDASWHMRYSNVKSAKQDPDLNLIISGVAVSLKPAQNVQGIVTTDVVFNVRQTAWNPQKLPIGTTITIRTLGGIVGNKRYVLDDFPMYQVGEHEILFLHFDRTAGIAGTLGGPSGRLLVQNGLIKPLNDQGMHIPSNTSENAFLASIPSA